MIENQKGSMFSGATQMKGEELYREYTTITDDHAV